MSSIEKLVCAMALYCLLAACAPCLMTMALGSAEAGMWAARAVAAAGIVGIAVFAAVEMRGEGDGR